MFERMLDKTQEPTFEEMLAYCGLSSKVWLALESFLEKQYDLKSEIRFPYGKNYGWGKSYKHKTKHICDIHTEKDAFTVFFQIHTVSIEVLKEQLSPYAWNVWENRYPCGNGGWMRYRVTSMEQLDEVEKLLMQKVKPSLSKRQNS